jgi:hypothetical protein
MDNLDNVEISPALHSHIVVNKIVEEIVKKVQLMPQYEKLARNIDLVLYICNLIEELVYSNGVKNQPKGFKRDLALRVFELIKFNKQEDKDFLFNSIDFLWTSGRIRKIKAVKRLGHFLKNLFAKNENK